ncbi:S-adenosyl-L-methionine-dependent methyltransferase [Biscogniauxia mediterranea]|nr:S-adenosyl-L-methionine-dependent methyltransferase [Biscogniauxia mediterranea]
MASHATSVTESSYDEPSATNSELILDTSESAVPELDNDISTDEYTSDYLSTRTTSYLGPSLGLDDGIGSIQFDTTSIYSPSHYPSIQVPYRTERPFDSETMNSTRSITELDINYVYENGRRYCGSYYMPNDDDEQVRLQLINQVYLKAFDGELTSIPLECPSHILDIGTAVGEWAIDMAEAYPECEVTGTDISNIFERQAPQNVFWEVDDAELDWERPSDYYDLIHLRNMAGAFADWQFIYRSAYTSLKPGGWIEVLDFDDHKGMNNFFSFFEPGSLIHKVAQDLQEASILSGRPRGVGHLEPRFLVNTGYVDVQLTEYAIPLRTEDGSTGKFWLLAMLNGMEPTCMRLLTKYKGWDPDDVRVACDMIGQELMAMALNPRRARGFVVKVRVMTGRKPGTHTRWSTAPISESGEVMKNRDEEMRDDASTDDGESGYGSYGRPGTYSNAGKRSFNTSPEEELIIDTEVISDTAVTQEEEASSVLETGSPGSASERQAGQLEEVDRVITSETLRHDTAGDAGIEGTRREGPPMAVDTARQQESYRLDVQTMDPSRHGTQTDTG